MKLFATATALGSLALSTVAQMDGNSGDYASQLLGALQQYNLTTLAQAAQQNADTLLPLLMQGNHTVFAPTDNAFSQLDNSTLGDNEMVLNLLSYHITQGAFPPDMLSMDNHTIARTYLNATEYVMLPGNQSQVLVLSQGMDNQSASVIQLNQTVNSTAYASVANLDIYIIDQVLDIPGNLTEVASTAGLSSLAGALQQYAPDVLPALVEAQGITVFAPTNEAFQSAMSTIGQVSEQDVMTVLAGHVLNGTVVYSSQLMDGQNVTTASGSTITVMLNETGAFVMSGNSTAEIVRSDVLLENGVVHVIDSVLLNTMGDPEAAASAASSNAEAGMTQTGEQTGGVGAQPTGGSGGDSGSESGGENPASTVKANTIAGVGAATMALFAAMTL